MRWLTGLGALRDGNYRLLFAGQVLSITGDEMAPVAISFAILDQGGSAGQVGEVLGAGTASMVLLLLVGGVMADRLPRRAVMLAADVVRAGAQAAVAVLLIAGGWRVWELAALEAAWGAGAAFFNPALTGLMPQLLSGDALAQGNALQNLSWSVGSVLGPSLAGILVATAGPGPAVAVDAGTFAVSVVTLSRLHLPPGPAGRGTGGLMADLRHGWQAFRARTWLWTIVVEFGLWHLLVFAPVIVLGAVVAKSHLGGAAAWGTILGGFGAGSVAGGLVALRYRPRRPLLAATVATSGFVPFPATLALALPVPAITAAAVVGGAGFALFGTLWDTTLQQQVPRELLSRVSAYDWFGSVALLPVGYAIAGPLANLVGTTTVLWVASAFMAVEVMVVLSVPSVRAVTAPGPAPPGTPTSAVAAAAAPGNRPDQP